MTRLRSLYALLPAFALGCGVPTGEPSLETSSQALKPTTSTELGKGGGTRLTPPQRTTQSSSTPTGALCTDNGITNHGGSVMHGQVNIYYIWYGNWSGNTGTTILTDLGNNLASSLYYNINTTYTDSTGSVMNAARLAGTTTDNYSHGTSLADADIQAIVSSALTSGRLPTDANGVYFVLTSSDVHETSGFCTSYCGWHTHATLNGADIKYSFVGDPDTQCPAACEEQVGSSPNGNPGADGMASVVAHEFEETTSDPDLNAWWDVNGEENADKCAWTFGTTYTANGANANMRLGNRDYLIQQNWVNAACGYCALGYGPSSAHRAVTATTSNTHANYFTIDDPFFNGKPGLVVTATQAWNPPGVSATNNNHPIGVWYSYYYNKWTIYNEDNTAPTGSFFIYGAYPSATSYVTTSTSSNVSGDTMWLDNPLINGNPNAFVIATHNLEPDGVGGATYDNKNIGVWYSSYNGRWGVFPEDASTFATGLPFNIQIVTGSGTQFQIASSSNSSGDSTYINNALSNADPNATVFVAQNWNPPGSSGAYNNRPVGVWYNSSLAQWGVYNQDFSTMTANSGFSVWILP